METIYMVMNSTGLGLLLSSFSFVKLKCLRVHILMIMESVMPTCDSWLVTFSSVTATVVCLFELLILLCVAAIYLFFCYAAAEIQMMPLRTCKIFKQNPNS